MPYHPLGSLTIATAEELIPSPPCVHDCVRADELAKAHGQGLGLMPDQLQGVGLLVGSMVGMVPAVLGFGRRGIRLDQAEQANGVPLLLPGRGEANRGHSERLAVGSPGRDPDGFPGPFDGLLMVGEIESERRGKAMVAQDQGPIGADPLEPGARRQEGRTVEEAIETNFSRSSVSGWT